MPVLDNFVGGSPAKLLAQKTLENLSSIAPGRKIRVWPPPRFACASRSDSHTFSLTSFTLWRQFPALQVIVRGWLLNPGYALPGRNLNRSPKNGT